MQNEICAEIGIWNQKLECQSRNSVSHIASHNHTSTEIGREFRYDALVYQYGQYDENHTFGNSVIVVAPVV